MKILHKNLHTGQAMISLLFFIIIAITISSGAVVLMINSSRAASKLGIGTQAYYIAESGAENAILRLLRNPNYTDEVLNVGDGTATIHVSGSNPYTIISTGSAQMGNYLRTIQVTLVSSSSGGLTVTSWKELY